MSPQHDVRSDFGALDALLSAALELHPDERDDFAHKACADNPLRLAALRQLLARSDEHDTRWQALAQDYARAGDGFAFAAPNATSPTQIGDWTIVSALGSGGMGDVFLAQRQIEGASQRGAIKVLASDRNTPELRARFARERRILALLGDPRIARFYDAGVLDDGRPWLAMEYIEGERIDRWCDAKKLDLHARVRLLVEVAQAVASAHTHLIVHRDIKPTNVLVGSDGSPRLLDFGIAKHLGDDDLDPGLTGTRQRLMTPHYASPEQLLGEPVGTASDIYQLGLLLFELCCGRRPFEDEENSVPLYVRAIAECDAPSLAKALDAGDDPQKVAAARGTSPAKLRRALRGDLRLIVAKALHREPGARYVSAGHFADDLSLYLAQQPVHAAAPSLHYRAKRLISRHRLGAVLTLALLVAVVAGVGATLWQTREAVSQRDQAQAEAQKSARLTEFLVGVFSQANPGTTQGADVSAKSLLDAAVQRIDAELPQRDPIRSDLLAAMASAYSGLGLRKERLSIALEALSIERQLQRSNVLTRRIVFAAAALRDNGDATRALELLNEAEARLRADPAESPGLLGFVMYVQGVTHFSLRDFARSEQRLEQALAQLRAAPDAKAEDIEAVLLMLSRRWASTGKVEQALVLVEELVAKIRGATPPRPANLVDALDALGSAYGKAGRKREQAAIYREALTLAETVYGKTHFDVAVMQHNLALALESNGELADALMHVRQAVEIGRLSVDELHSFLVAARIAQVRLRCANGDSLGAQTELVALRPAVLRFPQMAERLASGVERCSH